MHNNLAIKKFWTSIWKSIKNFWKYQFKIVSCIMFKTNHNTHYHFHLDKSSAELFLKINQKLNIIMANIQQLTQKVDELQVALDAEQEQVAAAVAALNKAIADLQALVAEGGTPEERQAVADKLDAIKADLEGTVPDAPTEPTDPVVE